ncbi:MAG: B12-binding domain-containing protein [Pseudorhodobacter sp.]
MQDLQSSEMEGLIRADEGGLKTIASWAMGQIAARRSRDDLPMRADLMRALVQASISPSTQAMTALASDLFRQKISAEDFADRYITAAAEEMGRAWAEDRMSFAEVTMGMARLQSLLRDLGNMWSADLSVGAGGAARSVLIVMPAFEQHSLGALLLMGQLRRRGVSVALALGVPASDICRRVRASRFDAVLISVACVDRLADLAEFVTAARAGGCALPPVVVGGGILNHPADVKAETGADAALKDVEQVLRFCSLLERNGARQRA